MKTKRKIGGWIMIAALLIAGVSQGAPKEEQYSPGELKREQQLFIGYLKAATNELKDAQARLLNGRCDFAAASTVAALADKDSSRIRQKGHLDRIKNNTAFFGVHQSKVLNAKYLEIRTSSNETEDRIANFITSLERTCPDSMWLIRAYKEALKKIENDPNAISLLEGIKSDMINAISAGKIAANTLTHDPVGGFLDSPDNAQARADFIKHWMNQGMSREDAEALADAIAKKDWATVEKILRRNPSQAATDLWNRLKGNVGSNWKPFAGGSGDTEYGTGGSGRYGRGGNGGDDDPASSSRRGKGSSDDGMASEEEVDIKGWPDWQTDANGNKVRGPKVTAVYPMGRNGTISREIEHWQKQAASDTKPTMTKDVFEWELVLGSKVRGKGTEEFWVENTAPSTKDREKQIERWEVLLNKKPVSAGEGDKFTVNYTDAGTYEIIATGRTKANGIPFRVKDTRTWEP